jgi:hypothetical protein
MVSTDNKMPIVRFDMKKIDNLSNFITNKLHDFHLETEPEMACNKLLMAYTEGINKFSKTFKPCRRKTPIKPWITPAILCSINYKNKLYKKYVGNKNIFNETKYKRYRNILTNIIRDCKRKYFEKKFEEHKHNGKKTWKLIGEALNKQPRDDKLPTCFVDDNETYTSDRIASGFNDFFTSVGQKLVSKMHTSNISPTNYLSIPNYPAFDSDLTISTAQVELIIKSLNSVGGGIDRISTKILLGTYKGCLYQITHFCNLCLRKAIFPRELKKALIQPVYKSGDKDKFTIYRPISLLPIFSKVLEKIYKRIRIIIPGRKLDTIAISIWI